MLDRGGDVGGSGLRGLGGLLLRDEELEEGDVGLDAQRGDVEKVGGVGIEGQEVDDDCRLLFGEGLSLLVVCFVESLLHNLRQLPLIKLRNPLHLIYIFQLHIFQLANPLHHLFLLNYFQTHLQLAQEIHKSHKHPTILLF